MSVYKKVLEIAKSYPAYDVVRRDVSPRRKAVELTDGEVLSCRDNNYLGSYTIGSVVSYALRGNECPLEAVELAKSFGHELYYIFGNASCLSRVKEAKKTYVEVFYGMLVYFEGKYFTIEKAGNDNLRLEAAETPEGAM